MTNQRRKPGFSTTNQPTKRGSAGRTQMEVAVNRIRMARLIGWKALEQSWQATLDKLEGK